MRPSRATLGLDVLLVGLTGYFAATPGYEVFDAIGLGIWAFILGSDVTRYVYRR